MASRPGNGSFSAYGSADGARVVPPGFPERPAKGKRYLMLVCVDPSGEKGVSDEVDPWVSTWDAAGVRLFGEVLRPPADGTLVRTRQGKVLAEDMRVLNARQAIDPVAS